ncbi:MAG: YdjY domain-containing protein [Phycisphaerae bacterium]|nr:YdjY domain-containing protein [Phycisphaerae bacterium]
MRSVPAAALAVGVLISLGPAQAAEAPPAPAAVAPAPSPAAAESPRHLVQELLDPAKRNAALDKLMQLNHYKGGPHDTALVNHVVVCPQPKGEPLYAVFKDEHYADWSGAGLGKPRGHVLLFDSDGKYVPFYKNANDPWGVFEDVNGDGIVENVESWYCGELRSCTILHVIPIVEKPMPLLCVAYNPKQRKTETWAWQMADAGKDGALQIQLGPVVKILGDPAHSRDDNGTNKQINPVVTYTWDKDKKAYVGPAGGDDQPFKRLDPEKPLKEQIEPFDAPPEPKPATSAPAADTPAPAEQPEAVVLKTLPGIVVDTQRREIILEGRVCLQKGALELVVCSQGTREHESIVVVKARPSHLAFALALVGVEPGRPGHMTEAGAFSPPAGQVLNITARFLRTQTVDGREHTETVEVPVWKLLALTGRDAALEQPIEWVAVARPEEAALRAADREGTVLCLSNFPEAVIDVPFESTAVNANLVYEANPAVVPPVGTAVELVIRPTARRIEPKKVQVEVTLRKGRPAMLDGKEMSLAEIKDAVNAMPISVRAAALKADADETFGRVMQVKDLLENALMRVRLLVLEPSKE